MADSEMLHAFPELIPDELIKRAEDLGAALLCDGMKGTGIPMDGCMEAAIMPVDMGMKVVGTAMTVESDGGDNLPIHVATYAAKPGYVMVIDGKACTERCYFGDLIMGAASAVGIKGMVIDGYVRDREGCVENGMPVFAKGFMQRGPKKEKMGPVNMPIHCGGLRVCPGDLVMGDADGVTVVPRDRLEEVLANAEKKHQYEINRRVTIQAYRDAVANGAELPQLAPQWVLDMLK